MQRNTGLRDPFAEDDDAPPRAATGRPPPRFPKHEPAPLRNVAGTSSSPYAGSLGAPRLAPARDAAGGSAGDARASTSTAPRPLGLSLGLPRSRMPPKHDTNTTEGDSPKTAADIARQADDAVRNTDSDALLSRLSALKLGYLPPEPFTQEFSSSSPIASSAGPVSGTSFPRPHQQGVDARRSPLINIGTYLRCTAIDAEIEAFLTQGDGPKQIISIGAGSDSRYWRIVSDARLSGQLHHYVEIDFPDNARQKLGRILRSATLRAALDSDAKVHGVPLCDLPSEGPVEEVKGAKEGGCERAEKPIDVLRSSKYSLLEADVRAIHPSTSKAEYIDPVQLFGTTSSRLDTQLPTLVLFECVLAYIEPDRADQLLRILSQTFEELHAVVYDIALAGETQHKPGHGGSSTTSYAPPTRFGSVMLQNLEMRKLSLPGARAYATAGAQCQRFEQHWLSATVPRGPVEASGRSLFAIWSALDAEQKSRLSRLEGLDEVEELDMLLKHYFIVRVRRRRSP